MGASVWFGRVRSRHVLYMEHSAKKTVCEEGQGKETHGMILPELDYSAVYSLGESLFSTMKANMVADKECFIELYILMYRSVL